MADYMRLGDIPQGGFHSFDYENPEAKNLMGGNSHCILPNGEDGVSILNGVCAPTFMNYSVKGNTASHVIPQHSQHSHLIGSEHMSRFISK